MRFPFEGDTLVPSISSGHTSILCMYIVQREEQPFRLLGRQITKTHLEPVTQRATCLHNITTKEMWTLSCITVVAETCRGWWGGYER